MLVGDPGGDVWVTCHLWTWMEFRGKIWTRSLTHQCYERREVMGVDMMAQGACDGRSKANQASKNPDRERGGK